MEAESSRCTAELGDRMLIVLFCVYSFTFRPLQ